MALITRLARLVRADLNAVLGRLESPDLVLGQAVLEMEQALDQERQALAKLEQAQARLARHEQDLAEAELRYDESVSMGLAPGGDAGPAPPPDALLRPLVRQRLEVARQRRALHARYLEMEAERGRLTQCIAEHAARLQDLRARAALAVSAAADAGVDSATDCLWSSQREVSWPGGAAVTEAEVELELRRLRGQAARPSTGQGGVA